MPLLDSFCVDHTIMNAPGVRLAKTMDTPKGDKICVFDDASVWADFFGTISYDVLTKLSPSISRRFE